MAAIFATNSKNSSCSRPWQIRWGEIEKHKCTVMSIDLLRVDVAFSTFDD